MLTEGPIPEFVSATPFDAFERVRAAAKAVEDVLVGSVATTPEQDFHAQPPPATQQQQQHRYGDNDDDDDEIVLAPLRIG